MDASKKDLTKVAPHPIRPALSFYDQDGHLMDPESLVEVNRGQSQGSTLDFAHFANGLRLSPRWCS